MSDNSELRKKVEQAEQDAKLIKERNAERADLKRRLKIANDIKNTERPLFKMIKRFVEGN